VDGSNLHYFDTDPETQPFSNAGTEKEKVKTLFSSVPWLHILQNGTTNPSKTLVQSANGKTPYAERQNL